MYGNIPKDFRLNDLMKISTTDKDCSPDRLEFSIESDNNKKVDALSIQRGDVEGKETYVILYATKEIESGIDDTYTIRVKVIT